MNTRPPARGKREPRLFSLRTVVIIQLAVLIGLIGAGLLYAAHRPVPLVVFSGLGIAGLALKILDELIE